MNKFYRHKKTNEVYERKLSTGGVKVEHTVKNEAWLYEDTKHLLQDMTPCEGKDAGRVEILADVIKQLDSKLMVAKFSSYVTFDVGADEDDEANHLTYIMSNPEKYGLERENEVCEVFSAINAKSCKVCAIGSLFMSTVDIHDQLNISTLHEAEMKGGFEDGWMQGDELIQHMKSFFSKKELRAMEQAFEGQSYGVFQPIDTEVNKEFRTAVVRKHDVDFKKATEEAADSFLREVIANTLKFENFSPERGLA